MDERKKKSESVWFCYLLRCRDGSFYVGITNDLEERLKEHSRGKDSDYTAKRRPVTLVWSQEFPSKQEARKREVELKGWSRRKKERLAGLPLRPQGERVNPSASPAARPQGKGA